MLVLVEVNGLPEGRVLLWGLEEGGLLHLDLAVASLDRLDDRVGVYALVDVKGDGWDLKGGVLGLTRPH